MFLIFLFNLYYLILIAQERSTFPAKLSYSILFVP